MRFFCFILAFITLFFSNCCTKEKKNFTKTSELYEEFKNPQMQYRPFVRWWWNGDKVEAGELKRELNILKDAGIGGVEINPVEFPSYCDSAGKESLVWLSPEWIDMLQVTFDEAERLGLTCDLIVGSGWPFGAEILEGEERAQVVVNHAEKVTGPTKLTICQDSIFKMAEPKISSPYKGMTSELTALRLYPNPAENPYDYTDLLPLNNDGTFEIDVPEGEFTVGALVKYTGFLEVINGAPEAAGPVLNHFDTAAVKKYLYNMSDKIQAQIGPLNKHVRALFTDSMELEGANWTSDMAKEFEARYGYDITDYLPFILFEIGSMGSAKHYNPVIPVTESFIDEIQRTRFDFETFKADLMLERFTHTYQAWCRDLGVKSRAQAYGRGFYPLENAMDYDIPEGEAWTTNWLRHKPGEEMSEKDYRRGRAYTMVNKFVSSAAHLAGNRTMSCEEMTNTYTVFNMTLDQLKLGGDQAAISGVTHSIFHGFNYSPNLEVEFPGWLRYGAFYSENNTWWKHFHLYNEYKARLSTALQHGDYQADIAILNPENDMWSTIGMQNEPFPNVTRAQYKTFIWECISKTGGGSDYVTENIINNAYINKGVISFNERKYNTLIIIDVESLFPETAKNIAQFAQSGGKVICIDTIPYKSLGLRKDKNIQDSIVNHYITEVSKCENFVFVKPPQEGFLPWYDSLMKAENLPHYMDIETPNMYLMQNRYTTDDGCEMVFISNSNRYESHKTKITFHKELTKRKYPWIWDLQTGERHRIYLEKDGSYEFDFGPAESILLVFDKNEGKPSDFKSEVLGVESEDFSFDWDVEFLHARTDTTFIAHFDTLIDLKDNDLYKHFAGDIVYTKNINIDSVPTILDLGLVHGVSELFVNGQSAGVKYFGRRIYDITPYIINGGNKIEVRVTTTLGNYMKSLPDENRVAYVYVNNKRRMQDFQSQGMIGPVRIFY